MIENEIGFSGKTIGKIQIDSEFKINSQKMGNKAKNSPKTETGESGELSEIMSKLHKLDENEDSDAKLRVSLEKKIHKNSVEIENEADQGNKKRQLNSKNLENADNENKFEKRCKNKI